MKSCDQSTLEQKILSYKREHEVAVAVHETARKAYIDSLNALEDAETAQKIVQYVAQEVQEQAHQRLSSVVTRCLEVVFEEPYQLRIEFAQKRGRTEANLVFVREGMVLTDPLNEAGGGTIDVAAFALRLGCLVMERPRKARLLVLDEPFTRIRGKRNRERMRGLLESLSQEFGVQFVICVDHDAYPEFLLGNVVEVV